MGRLAAEELIVIEQILTETMEKKLVMERSKLILNTTARYGQPRETGPMIHDAKQFFGLEKEFRNADFLGTESYRQIYDDVVSTIKDGYLVALTGIVVCGKTVTARKIRHDLKKRSEILVSTLLTVEKHRVKLGTLMHALFADLMTDKKRKSYPSLNFGNAS
jgi:ABC-type glutathione transport system ATPase component